MAVNEKWLHGKTVTDSPKEEVPVDVFVLALIQALVDEQNQKQGAA